MVLPQARLRNQTGSGAPYFSYVVAQTIGFHRLRAYRSAGDLVAGISKAL